MRPLERIPAVRRIETNRNQVFAVEITGEFTSADAENLCGLLEGAFALHERIDLLVRIAGLEEIDLDDVKPQTVDFMREHVAQHVNRCAIIEGNGWSSRIERLFANGSNLDLRHFTAEEEAQAWAWLDAREIPDGI